MNIKKCTNVSGRALHLCKKAHCQDSLRFYCFPTVPDFADYNENSKSQISPIVWDERGQIWKIVSVSIFPTRPSWRVLR